MILRFWITNATPPSRHRWRCKPTAMALHLIYARARNGVIGLKGQMPWHLPEDLAHLKKTTLGCPVILGRKTWDSIPAKFRPLPGRQNIVVTRQTDWKTTQNLGSAQNPTVLQAASLPAAIALNPPGQDVWVLGGAEIYAQALPLAQSAVITEIDANVEGDAFAPVLGPAWVETARSSPMSRDGLVFSFVTYQNTANRR